MGIQNAVCRTRQLQQLCTDDQQPRSTESQSRYVEHVFSLLYLQDAARAACVPRSFLRSWRHYSNLTFSEKSLGLNDTKLGLDEETVALHGKAYKLCRIESFLVNRIDHILKNHSGIGVETLKLQLYPCSNIDASCLDGWLQIAIKSGIKDVSIELSSNIKTAYNFPCELLSNETGRSIQFLRLSSCAFRPTGKLGCLRSLTRLSLHLVHTNDEELGRLLSNSVSLEKIEISCCNEIVCLKIPCTLYQLSLLRVLACKMLRNVEVNAPKLSSLHYGGSPAQISFGNLLQVRDIHMLGFLHLGMIHYARTKLTSIAPNIESLTLSSPLEKINTPMLPCKLLHLKYLDIQLSGGMNFLPNYDLFSLISFPDASPSLKSFILRLKHEGIRHNSILGESTGDRGHIRQKPECRHDHLEKVTITGFCSLRSLVELTTYILENTSSLKQLTLDTTRDDERNFPMIDRCLTMSRVALIEAHKSLEAILTYIEGKIPPNVCLKVLGPCSSCQPDIS
ncbi:hypothetical protein ACP4OV_000374 [Aristida adscensionis]